MQSINPQFLLELQQQARSKVELVEFFVPNETDFTPAKAALRLCKAGTATGTGILGNLVGGYSWGGYFYERRVASGGRGDIQRNLGSQANTVNLTIVNNDFAFSKFVLQNRLEGYWVQVRQPSITAPNESLILFAGRCSKPDEVFPDLQLTITQDIGASDAELPERKLYIVCPLAVKFKEKECRGGQELSLVGNADYQAAIECDGARKTCAGFSNIDNFQGLSFITISGTYTYQVEEVKRFLLLFSRKKRRTASAAWSSASDAQQDTPIPEVGGVVQVEAVPFMHADTGAKVKFLSILAGADTDGVFNVAIRDAEYLPAPDVGTEQIAYGALGSQGQPESLQFPGAGKFSGLTWVEGVAIGSDPTSANDKAPTIVAILRGRKYETPSDVGVFTEDDIDWTDCGAYMARHYLLTTGRHPRTLIDDESVIAAAKKTFEPVIDDTGFEQATLPSTVTGGVDFRAYASAGGFGAATIDKILLLMAQGKKLTGGYAALVEAYYRYVNQNAFPTFQEPLRKVRRRYTTNFALKETTTLSDFFKDVLFPSFNGRYSFSAAGKIRIDVDGPAPHTFLTADVSSGTTLNVEDVTPWLTQMGKLVVVGPHTAAAELTRVQAWKYADVTDDPIDVAVANTGTLSISVSSSTLMGGTDLLPSRATVSVGGTVSAGAYVELTIDGITVDYTALADDDRDAVAGYLCALVNGEPTLRRYVKADWDGESSDILLTAKTGTLTVADALTKQHAANDEVLVVQAAFGDTQDDKQTRYLENSFAWPLGSRSSSYNRFAGSIHSSAHDWASVPIERNVIWHQKETRRTNTMDVNLSGVDTAHQAARLLKIISGKERYCDWFCSFTATGAALLLDLGDVIAVSHYSGAGYLNFVPVVIEDITIDGEQNAHITARLYRTDIYDDRLAAVIDSPMLQPIQSGSRISITVVTAGTDTLTAPGHGTAVDDIVYVATGAGGALPDPLVEGVAYYVQNVAGDDIKLAATLGGAAIDITTAGTLPLYVITGLAANEDVPPPNVPRAQVDSISGLGQPQAVPAYGLDGYGTGGGPLLS